MLIIDKPYVSDFLIETIKRNNIPVLETGYSKQYKRDIGPTLLSEEQFIAKLQNIGYPQIYSNSENAIGWIAKHLSFNKLPQTISLFKDKTKFRELIASIYPDFYFKPIEVHQLDTISITELSFPFIIKPATGFFSMGVYKVNNQAEWEQTKHDILPEIEQVRHLYPAEVLNTNTFIIEEYIEGEEFAFDAYFNEDGQPVLLNTFKHFFASSEDVSDRVYYTSKHIIEDYRALFTDFLKHIGELTSIKNFPVHVEVRINDKGQPIPIEINPLRFGGWCTTADLTYHAFGFNPYEYYFSSQKPDWESILAKQNDHLYSVIVLDNSTGVDAKQIKSFDYNRLTSQFSNLLELRKVDFKEYPVFGFIYAEVQPDRFHELESISKSTLNEYIEVK